MSFEFVLITAIGVASVTGNLTRTKLSFLGLFAVATLLYMEASNAFMSAQAVNYYTQGQQLHTIRTVTAGAIMTAVVNGLLVAALGHAEEPAPDRSVETTKTVAHQDAA
jgi:hypothetical protein